MLRKNFSQIVGERNCTVGKEALTEFSTDTSRFTQAPVIVARPGNTQEIAEIVRFCRREGLPIVARGAGTGTTGGAVPCNNGVVMDLSRLNRILDIDPRRRIAVVEPAVLNDDLRRAAEKSNLTYPPDPASSDKSTLGGNVAENAGGLHCVKYGVTRDFLLGSEVMTMAGEIIRTGELHAGRQDIDIDLTPLWSASEGTLVVFTKLALKLIPCVSQFVLLLVRFGSLEQAAETVSDIIRARVMPSALEFMDEGTLDALSSYTGEPRRSDVGALLLIELDGAYERQVAEQKREVIEICKRQRSISIESATDPAQQEKLWRARRNVSPSLKAIAPIKINEDVVTPRSKIPELVNRIKEIGSFYQLRIVTFGHAGDGNVHVNIMIQESEYSRAKKAADQIFQAAIDLNGVISGEHGIGLAKKNRWMQDQSEPVLTLHRNIKQALDPDWLLNPGKIFDND